VPERVRGTDGRRVRPHKLHFKTSSPSTVLGGAAVLWLSLTLAFATLVVPRILGGSVPPSTLLTLPSSSSLFWGGIGALAGVMGFANLLIAKGIPAALGKALVCKPSFIAPALLGTVTDAKQK